MVVKMAAAVATVALLLLCCSVTAAKDCDAYAATDDNFTLSHNLTMDPSDTLKWYHNGKLVYRGQNGKVVTSVYTVDAKESLKFMKIKQAKGGSYRVEVINKDGATKSEKELKLCVMDPVPEVKLTMECLPTMVKFTCKVKAQNPNITWMQNKEVLKKEKTATLLRAAKHLMEDKIKCIVSNPASSQTSETLTQTCFKPMLFGLESWIMMIILGGGGGLVLVLIIIVIVCCCRTRRKKTMKVKDEEELRLGWADSRHQQQQQQQQHYLQGQCQHPPSARHNPRRQQQQQQQQQQPPGHTGPRQHRSKPPRDPQKDAQPQLPRPRGQPRPGPRGPPQGSKATDGEGQPPPLPQPRRTTNKVV